jgi:ceramide glucosyltransferase
METSLYIFLFLGLLLLAQSVNSLRDGFRFIRYVRRSLGRAPAEFTPRTAVIIPIKGADQETEGNIGRFLAQRYPRYHMILVVEDENDPAYSMLNDLLVKTKQQTLGPETTKVLVAGASESRGQKVHNLLRGLEAVDPQAEVVVFADADARPGAEWLRSLVAPLGNPTVTVSTGFRWYLPGKSFVSQLCAAWDTSIATLLGEHGRNFPWGGSMALRVQDFKRLEVAERYWASTVSDDYAVRRAVQDAGGWIRFEPRCLVASHQDSNLREFLRWSTRQMIITRAYAPTLWALGLISHILYGGTFVLGLLLVLNPHVNSAARFGILALLAGILILGMAKGGIRSRVAREVFPDERLAPTGRDRCYWNLTPLVPWVMLYNLITAGFKRRIEWRGIHYRLRRDGKVEIIRRESA